MKSDYSSDSADDLIVTGQKRDEPLQKTPISVSVLSEHDIETRGVNTAQDVARLTPNFVIDNHYRPGTQNISFRGFTNVTGGKPPFAVVVDGVQEPSQEYLLQQLFDVQQIEVLRGPQGILYGAGAIAGAINIVTKKPTNDFEAEMKVGAFEGNDFTTSGSISGPLKGDVAMFRVAGYVKSFRGLIQDVTTNAYVDRSTDYGVQGRLILQPAVNTSIDLRVRYFRQNSGGLWLLRTPAALIDTYSQLPNGDIDGFQHRHVTNVSGTVKHDFGGVTFTSISGYQSGKTYGIADGDFTASPTTAEKIIYNVDILNQELRLTSSDDHRFSWLISAFGQKLRVLDVNAYGPVVSPGNYAFAAPIASNRYRSELWALAAEARYKLTDQLTVIAGGRYDHDEESARDLTLNVLNKKGFSEFQPKVSLTYQATDALLVYGDYSRGFRSGGFNPNSPIGARQYTNETSDTFEIGEKSSFFNDRLILNAAAYYTRYRNEQFIYAVPLPQGNYSSIANIPRSRSYGGEVEAQAAVTRRLRFNSSFGYSPTQIREFPVAGYPVGAFVNKYVPRIYKYTIGSGGEYTAPISDNMNLLARLDVSHRSRVFYNVVNTVKAGPKTFVDGRIQINSTERWSAALVGRNIFNERTNAAVGGSPFLAPATISRSYNEPRQLGVEFQLKL
ncbi:TonB-dependent receptor [Sphingomonas sp.]|uniref:TonB-dependent receptor n=1 Tax=Sphingomonas sp. TaxID=28214 RepID=UPI0025F6C66D|nr:TonB-dependent receptor [Sphingomonas sp.]